MTNALGTDSLTGSALGTTAASPGVGRPWVAGPAEGLVLATGHFRNGVLLTPITADAIVGYLETGQLPGAAAHFTIERFGGPA